MVLAAVAVATPIAAAYLLVAGILAPGVRYVLGERGAVFATGLTGLSPSLMAISLPAFFETGWADLRMWGVLVIAVAVTAAVTHVLVRLFPFPILALPFLLVFWVLYALQPRLPDLDPGGPSHTASTTFEPVTAILDSLGEAAFSPTPWSGLLLLAGVLLGDWRHGVMAACGALTGTLVAYYYASASTGGLDSGLYGFNGVLTAVAVFALCGGRLRLAILGAIIATIITPAISDLGVVALSAPFVVTTWIILALGWLEDRFQPISEREPARPGTAADDASASGPTPSAHAATAATAASRREGE
jgi:urea transporter